MDPEALVEVVPGFKYAQALYGAPSFVIRGVDVNDSSLGITTTASVYVDQVPLPNLVEASGAAFDLERVVGLPYRRDLEPRSRRFSPADRV